MTAAIKVNPNASAIGPSLFDATREKWEQQERMRESQDAAFEDHFSLWRRFSYIDQEKKKAREEIAEVMSAAMSDLYGNTKDSEAFDQALFTWFCSKDNAEATNALHELLDKHVRAAVRKEWERERRIAA